MTTNIGHQVSWTTGVKQIGPIVTRTSYMVAPKYYHILSRSISFRTISPQFPNKLQKEALWEKGSFFIVQFKCTIALIKPETKSPEKKQKRKFNLSTSFLSVRSPSPLSLLVFHYFRRGKSLEFGPKDQFISCRSSGWLFSMTLLAFAEGKEAA